MPAAGDVRSVQPVAASIRRVEPRVTQVDGAAFLGAAFPDGGATLSRLLARDVQSRLELPADYLLLAGKPSNEQIAGTGLAAPFPMIPLCIVGYERRRERESVEAVLVAVHDAQPAE